MVNTSTPNNLNLKKHFLLLLIGFIATAFLSSHFIFNAKKFSLISIVNPVLIIFEAFIAYILFVGTLKLNNISVEWKILAKAILTGISVFLLQYLAEFIWLIYNKQHYQPYYLRNFSSLSLYQLYHPTDLPSYLIYPMQTFNLWEVLYILTIIFVAKKLTENQIPKLGRTLAIAYCLGLFSWFVMVTFINLLNQPI